MSSLKINSLQNPRVKHWAKFHKNSFRKRSDHFLAEGQLECLRGMESGYELVDLIICKDLITIEVENRISDLLPKREVLNYVDIQVYNKLAYRKDAEGIMAVFHKRISQLEDFEMSDAENNLFIIVENIEKPGNLGAILRTADAIKARAVILCGAGTDQYNPNVIRASLGTVFSVPVVQSSKEDIINWSRINSIPLYRAALPAYNNFYSLDFTQKTAFMFGGENSGLSDFWLEDQKMTFTIPMHGIADSLNLSVSVAIVGYEYLRRFPVLK